MKEFVEKLIERLEEKRGENFDDNSDYGTGKWCAFNKSIEIVNQLAEEYNQDSTKNNQGWIPVTERLPEDCVDVLVCFEYFRYGEYNRLFQTIGVSYTYDGEWSGFVNGSSGWSQLSILAWQPLPEAYNPLEPSNLDKLSQEPKTRIEHIHSMSVEEMADAIMERSEISTCLDFCQNFCGECEHIPESECKKCLIKYLNSPVEQQKTIPTEHFKERVNRVL